LYLADPKEMGNRKRKSNRELKFTQQLLDDLKRRKEEGESGRQPYRWESLKALCGKD
jgi:hypothetical protein